MARDVQGGLSYPVHITNDQVRAEVISQPSIPAGDNNIGNVDIASIAAGSNLIGKVGIDQVTANANEVVVKSITAGANIIGATKDAGAQWTSVFGVGGAAVVSADITSATAVTDAPTAGQKIVIDDIIAATDTAMNILFEEETSGTDIFKLFLPVNGPVQITPRNKVKLATADKKLTAKASVAGNVGITVTYHSEA